MLSYQKLLHTVWNQGDLTTNRTGIDTVGMTGMTWKSDCRVGFPIPTTKKFYMKSMMAELAGFLEGSTSLRRFQQLGTHIWDANVQADAWQDRDECESPDDFGEQYGYTWRNWESQDTRDNTVDQLADLIAKLKSDPTDRRMIVSAWKPDRLSHMCLPPCHILFQVNVFNGFIDLTYYMRSVDLFLGLPFDQASYALLLHIIAQQTGFKARYVTCFMSNAHIYVNHKEQVKTQLSRAPYDLPQLVLDHSATIDNFKPRMAALKDYEHHPAIAAEMAV